MYHLKKLIPDTFRKWRNLQEQLEVIKRKILNHSVEPIVNQLFHRSQEYETKLQGKLKNRGRKNNYEELGPFSIKSNERAPISKDSVLETFLAMVENKIFDIKRAQTRPISNLSKFERTAMNQLRSSNDISVRLQDKGSRFVISDRQAYIDKVESNLNNGSFDV